MDLSVSVQDDFYQFACGGWCRQNPIPDDYSSFSVFDKLALETAKQLNNLLEETSRGEYAVGSVEKKISDLYRLCLDVERREKEGIDPLLPMLKKIEAIPSKDSLSSVLGQSMEFGLFDLYVAPDEKNSQLNILNEFQGGFTLGDKEYYVDTDKRSIQIRKEYVKHIARMFNLCGYKDGDMRAQTVLRLETRLAQKAKNNIQLRDPNANYHKMPISDLNTLVPEIDWSTYFEAMRIKTQFINISQIEHIKEVGKMLQEESLDDLKTLFLWQTIDGAALFLTKALYDQNFYFYEHILSGTIDQPPLWKRATRLVNSILGEAVGQMYVHRYFSQEHKTRALALIENLKHAFAQRIKRVTWMEEKTKTMALQKLAKMDIKAGYPDKWRDYSKLDIDPSISFYENIRRATVFEQEYALSFLDKPVDKAKWHSLPQTVNAYYSPIENEICFPTGILQPPFFDITMDDAYNYGTIGTIIGHEMTHGFDDEGRQFDENGNLANWWTKADVQAFTAKTNLLLAYFDGLEVYPNVFNKGELTLGENIADQGGLLIARDALFNLLTKGNSHKNQTATSPICESVTTQISSHPNGEKVADERSSSVKGNLGSTGMQKCDTSSCEEEIADKMRLFYLAFAAMWAENIRKEELLQQVKTDPHTLSKWRVLGTLAHIDEWYSLWEIDHQSPVYLTENQRVTIW